MTSSDTPQPTPKQARAVKAALLAIVHDSPVSRRDSRISGVDALFARFAREAEVDIVGRHFDEDGPTITREQVSDIAACVDDERGITAQITTRTDLDRIIDEVELTVLDDLTATLDAARNRTIPGQAIAVEDLVGEFSNRVRGSERKVIRTAQASDPRRGDEIILEGLDLLDTPMYAQVLTRRAGVLGLNERSVAQAATSARVVSNLDVGQHREEAARALVYRAIAERSGSIATAILRIVDETPAGRPIDRLGASLLDHTRVSIGDRSRMHDVMHALVGPVLTSLRHAIDSAAVNRDDGLRAERLSREIRDVMGDAALTIIANDYRAVTLTEAQRRQHVEATLTDIVWSDSGFAPAMQNLFNGLSAPVINVHDTVSSAISTLTASTHGLAVASARPA